MNRPQTTLVLAMTADGKIADQTRSPARFSSAADRVHLEKQISLADGTLFGAGTLRAYGTTLSVKNPQLLQARKLRSQRAQPVQIVCSAEAEINPELPFFRQSVPRWLLTTTAGAKRSSEATKEGFEQIIVAQTSTGKIDWSAAFAQLAQLGLKKLAILGGGKLVASLLEADLIDEFWLTVCPIILGGVEAPTPVEGTGFLSQQARRLELLSVETIAQEVFLHYRLQH